MSLSKEDHALYDRQIRLWGLEAQHKIRSGKVIVYGRFTGVSHELVKNLVLKGVGEVVLMTNRHCSSLPADYSTESLLFAPPAILDSTDSLNNEVLARCIASQAIELNPSVKISELFYDEECVGWEEGASFVVAINEFDLRRIGKLNDTCRKRGIPFQVLNTRGIEALLINDFGPDHLYHSENKTEEFPTEDKRHRSFLSVSELLDRHEQQDSTLADKKRSSAVPSHSPKLTEWHQLFKQQDIMFFGEENAAVNAIMGGVVAQEVIKGITGRDLPIHNVLLFNGSTLDSQIISIS